MDLISPIPKQLKSKLKYISISPPNLSMMLVWNNLADPDLSAFSHFAWFSQTVTLNCCFVEKNQHQLRNLSSPDSHESAGLLFGRLEPLYDSAE